jgi:hypothetical protein
MKQITAYQTRDGEVFTDQEEAAYHEGFLDQDELIEKCLNDFKDLGQNSRSLARQSIKHWEKWRIKHAIQ